MLKISFVGDILCQLEQLEAVKRCNENWNFVFKGCRQLWADADYVVGNLETPVGGCELRLTYERMRFNAPVEFLEGLRTAGIDFLSTANNHTLDRGVVGLERTIENLNRFEFDHVGTYLSKVDSEQIFVKTLKGVRIAFVSCTYGTNQGLRSSHLPPDQLWRVDLLRHQEWSQASLASRCRRHLSNGIPYGVKKMLLAAKCRMGGTDAMFSKYVADSVDPCKIGLEVDELYLNRVCEKIRRAKILADVVIVLPHVGGQCNPAPGLYQRWVERRFVAEGADLVVANHAHTPLGCDRVGNGVLVVNGLGDFFANSTLYPVDPYQNYSIVFNAYVGVEDKRFVKYDFTPIVREPRHCGLVSPVSVEDYYGRQHLDSQRERILVENEGVARRFQNLGDLVQLQRTYLI